MDINALQSLIRAKKSPLALTLAPDGEHFPGYPEVLRYCVGMIEALAESVPAVVLRLLSFTGLSARAAGCVATVAARARELGLYTVAQTDLAPDGETAAALCDFLLPRFDALTMDGFAGSAVLDAAIGRAAAAGGAVFVRTGTAAGELQTLVAGDRRVGEVLLDMTAREARGREESAGALLSAARPAELKAARARCPGLFLLAEGFGGESSALGASGAFDDYGHGALLCVGAPLRDAWLSSGAPGARAAAEALLRAVKRFVTLV